MGNSRVLVTGCAGFIGSILSEKLIEQGYEVIGIDCFTPYYSIALKRFNLKNLTKSERFSLLEVDLSEIPLYSLVSIVKGVDYIIHEAAQPGVRNSWGESFQEYVRHNIITTQKLLEAIIKIGRCRHFIYASSSSVYGNIMNSPLKEDMIPKPYSPYGVTKLTAEFLCQTYLENFNLPITILRYFTVYGPRQRPDMAFHKFAKALLSGEVIEIYGCGDQVRDFTYVDDVAEATISTIESKESIGEIINVGSNNPIKLIDAVKIIADIIGVEPKYRFSKELKGEVKSTYADISKAEKILGWKPKITIKEGLEKEIMWIKHVMSLGLL